MSLVESYIKEQNPALIEIEKLKARIALLEQKFENEISKRRGPKTKNKNIAPVVEKFQDISDIIFIEKENPEDKNEAIIIHKNGDDKTAPIISFSDETLKELLDTIANSDVGTYITIKDYKILNKVAQKDEIGDWLVPCD